MLNTPVLLLVFNRLDTTQQVFAKIREAQPRQLFIGSDGARAGKEGEVEKVQAVRQYILDKVDWDCEVKTLFREQNLGCGKAVSEAITWFFENVEQGIILEDDTLPELSFFTFCEQLLERYKNDETVCHISGTNLYYGKKWGDGDYFFSNYPLIWGWATWRNAWTKYAYDLKVFANEDIDTSVLNFVKYKAPRKYWKMIFDIMTSDEPINTWDYQWFFTCWKHKGLSIFPNKNLIKNIGFGEDATHTTQMNTLIALVPTQAQQTEIAHPSKKIIFQKAETLLFETYFQRKTSIIDKIKSSIVKIIPKSIKKHLKNILKTS